MFLKLYFSEAYDKLDHAFLWDTLHAMGFCDRNIGLVKGLLCSAQSKVHANGIFYREIHTPIEGNTSGLFPDTPPFCHLTPTFIAYLKALASEEGIQGISIRGQDQQLNSQLLFADDTRLFLMCYEENFTTAKASMLAYERIYRAKLNVDKSNVVKLDEGEISPKYATKGCKAP